MKRKVLGWGLFSVSFIPLIIYPFVILADIMSIAGIGALKLDSSKEIASFIKMICFIILNSLYPLTYAMCLIKFIRDKSKKILVAIIPYIHFFITFMFFNILDK